MTKAHIAADGTVYEINGQGRPLILIHGVGLERGLWVPLMPLLAARFQVVTYDLLGHGESPDLPAKPRLSDFGEQFKRLHQHLGLPPSFVAGFSLGGLITQRILLDDPEKIAAAAILNSVFNRTEVQRAAILARLAEVERNGMETSIEPAIQRWFNSDWLVLNRSAAQGLRTSFLPNRPLEYAKAYRVFATADRELADDIRCIQTPTLVITSEDDANSTPEMARTLAAQILGAKVKIIRGLKHMGLWEDPGAFAGAMTGFFSNQADPVTRGLL